MQSRIECAHQEIKERPKCHCVAAEHLFHFTLISLALGTWIAEEDAACPEAILVHIVEVRTTMGHVLSPLPQGQAYRSDSSNPLERGNLLM